MLYRHDGIVNCIYNQNTNPYTHIYTYVHMEREQVYIIDKIQVGSQGHVSLFEKRVPNLIADALVLVIWKRETTFGTQHLHKFVLVKKALACQDNVVADIF